MQYRAGKRVYAPTDLSRWAASPYASWMSRLAIECPARAPSRDEADALLSRLATRGLAHEDALEARFRADGLDVVNVANRLDNAVREEGAGSRDEALELTAELLRAGTDVVAQATLSHDDFRGHADFLVKVPGASDLGNFHYEVWDTKLARRVKPGMVLQLCCYADMLEAVQGCRASSLVVALGNGCNERIRMIDCFDYYLAVKAAFLVDQAAWCADVEPDPAAYADHGEWSEHAAMQLAARDHPCRVARITSREIQQLAQAGIGTMSALATTSRLEVPGVAQGRLEWLKRQATLQVTSAGEARPRYHVHLPEAGGSTALAALPEPSPLDVFFDIEGFPLDGDGLEYLWGCTYLDDDGQRAFRDEWAHDTTAERRACESFIDWVHARWLADPGMHVYHYAPYEVTACKRLSGTYGTREAELDDLLRNEVFVDLYAVVTQGLQIGEPRYSIKNVERLYRPTRTTDVASGGDSVVVYDLWRERHARGEDSADWRESTVLASLRDYNRDDCDSTLELRDWLLVQRDVGADGQSIGLQPDSRGVPERASCHPPEAEPEPSEEIVARLALRDRLLARAAAEERGDGERALLATLAGVLEFHRREDKNVWWRYFERIDPANTSLADDPACLADCRRTERAGFKPTPKARNLAWEYGFDTRQAFKGIAAEVYIKGTDNGEGKPRQAKVLRGESSLEHGRVVLQCKVEPPPAVTLVPNELVSSRPIPAAIDAVIGDIESGRTTRSALLDFLERRPPRFEECKGGKIIRSIDTALEDTIEAVQTLDRSCLVIQGPPGAGKSYTGARIIAALIAEGQRVGIASNSHAAIGNLLASTVKHCRARGIEGHFVRSKKSSDELDELGIPVVANGKLAEELRAGCVIGTTAWGFARDDLADALDVLVIDEAGQVSIANLVAMSRCARNLVIMGDQRQLGQPTQGVHPAESGLSVLDYRLGDVAAVDPEHGVFLAKTYRLHPAVNAPLSRHVYAGRLETASVTASRTLVRNGSAGPLDREAGIAFVPVEHEGNQQASDEEVEAIVSAMATLCERRLTCEDGTTRPVTIDDMLFVAPYNAQVARLSQALGAKARVGSVDRFQGQEAPIVFLSLCASEASAAPRGAGFLFDRNRLNVAVSRAQTLCVLVGHPRLKVSPVGTLADLKRVNFVAALMAAGASRVQGCRGARES